MRMEVKSLINPLRTKTRKHCATRLTLGAKEALLVKVRTVSDKYANEVVFSKKKVEKLREPSGKNLTEQTESIGASGSSVT